MKSDVYPVIGWREWVRLPDLGVKDIKVKVDTGARSSSLHAINVNEFKKDGIIWVKFNICPMQRKNDIFIEAEAPLLEYRPVKSSSGKISVRPVIITNIVLLGLIWPVELTLAGRDTMGFRMLLGREAVRNRFLVDSGRSYYGARPPRQKKNGKGII